MPYEKRRKWHFQDPVSKTFWESTSPNPRNLEHLRRSIFSARSYTFRISRYAPSYKKEVFKVWISIQCDYQPNKVNNNTPPALNPSTPKSDQHLSSPYNISSESFIKVQNKRNDHQLKKLLIVKQILPVSTLGNVKRIVWRICILMLGCKWFNWTVKDAKFVRCDILLPTIIKPHHNDNEICVYDISPLWYAISETIARSRELERSLLTLRLSIRFHFSMAWS